MSEPTLPVVVRHLDSIQDKLERIQVAYSIYEWMLQHQHHSGVAAGRFIRAVAEILDSGGGFGDDPPDFVPLEKVRC